MEKNSLPVSALEEPATLRLALDALSTLLDGSPAAGRTAHRKRACLSDVLGLAVERRYFSVPVNPLSTVKWTAPMSAEEVDMEVARRAGHSVAVLLRVYAKILAQAQERANRQIEAGLREWDGDGASPGGRLGDMR
ncbi:hypothetical protein ACIPWY_29245 [Streptomyces sp. NPDC090032]|uniref:hypothetical protein n=1 Tax=unclassified Streptomyces TaxID=2593676 RepID=UPI003722975F